MGKGLYTIDWGDGSVYTTITESYALAEYMDEYHQEDGGGWGESSAQSIDDSDVETAEKVLYEYLIEENRESLNIIDFYNTFKPSLEISNYREDEHFIYFKVNETEMKIFNYQNRLNKDIVDKIIEDFKSKLSEEE